MNNVKYRGKTISAAIPRFGSAIGSARPVKPKFRGSARNSGSAENLCALLNSGFFVHREHYIEHALNAFKEMCSPVNSEIHLAMQTRGQSKTVRDITVKNVTQ